MTNKETLFLCVFIVNTIAIVSIVSAVITIDVVVITLAVVILVHRKLSFHSITHSYYIIDFFLYFFDICATYNPLKL